MRRLLADRLVAATAIALVAVSVLFAWRASPDSAFSPPRAPRPNR